jgi:hypothetical protein
LNIVEKSAITFSVFLGGALIGGMMAGCFSTIGNNPFGEALKKMMI